MNDKKNKAKQEATCLKKKSAAVEQRERKRKRKDAIPKKFISMYAHQRHRHHIQSPIAKAT